MSISVDLNSDLGEGFGPYRMGDDAAMLSVVTSANVACGLHAGDPEIMAITFRAAREQGVAIGAHPGFPDLPGFGRRRIPFTPGETERIVAYQVGAAQALAVYAGHRITYVKPHGALANIAEDIVTGTYEAARADRRGACLRSDCCPPLLHGTRSEDAQRAAGDEVTLDVEGVVNGRMHGEEPLGRSGRFEPLQLPLSSPNGLVRVLRPVALAQPLLMVSR